jgi:hypothetical protein
MAAGQLSQPRSGWMGGDPEDVDLAGGVFNDEERVEPGQGDRVDVEQVGCQDCVRLGVEELSVQFGPDRRGDGSMRAALRIFHTVEAPIG